MKNLFRRRRSLSCEANNEKDDLKTTTDNHHQGLNNHLDNNFLQQRPISSMAGHASLRRRIPRSRTSDLAQFRLNNNSNNNNNNNNNNNQCNGNSSRKTDWSYCRPPRPSSEDFSSAPYQDDNNLQPQIVHKKRLRKHHSFTNRLTTDNINATFAFASEEEDEYEDESGNHLPRPVLRPLSNSNSFTSFENNKSNYLSTKVNN